jgi:hypothetical protein
MRLNCPHPLTDRSVGQNSVTTASPVPMQHSMTSRRPFGATAAFVLFVSD